MTTLCIPRWSAIILIATVATVLLFTHWLAWAIGRQAPRRALRRQLESSGSRIRL